MTLIEAFAESRNIPALRLADKVGIKKVIEVAHRFGVTSDIPAFLPVAIGAADITLAEQVGAYSVFPNDGIRIAPHYIRRVDPGGRAAAAAADDREVREVLSVDIAREMMVLLQAVVQHGTAAAASQMKHAFGGKTGTTNGYTDAWFIGFSPSVTCGTWIGFDNRQSLGEKETGARAALPMWMDFMKAAVADKPNEEFARANAPKRQIEVQAEPDDEAMPPKKAAPQTEQPDGEDLDGTGSTGGAQRPPEQPPAAQVQRTPDAAAKTPSRTSAAPLAEAMPDDTGGSDTKGANGKPGGPGKVKKLFHLFHKEKKNKSDTPPD